MEKYSISEIYQATWRVLPVQFPRKVSRTARITHMGRRAVKWIETASYLAIHIGIRYAVIQLYA